MITQISVSVGPITAGFGQKPVVMGTTTAGFKKPAVMLPALKISFVAVTTFLKNT
jgi:hypothetical protein